MVEAGSRRTRAQAPRGAALALLGVLYWSAHTMLRPLVGPYVLAQGGSHTDASIALASFAVLPTLLAVPIGAFTDRWGVRRLLAGGAALMAAGGIVLLLPTAITGIAGVVVAQALTGLGTLAVWVGLQTVATGPAHEDESTDARNARIATFSLFLAAGQAIGPVAGSVLAELGGYRLSFAVFVAASLGLMALARSVPASGPRSGPPPSPLGAYRQGLALMRDRTVLVTLLVSFSALVVLDFRNAYHPLLFTEAGLAQWQIGLLLGIAAVFGFLARPAFPPAMRRLGPRAVVGLVLTVSVTSVSAVVAFPASVVPLAALAAVNGFALGFAQPLTLTLMADASPADQRGLASGLRSTANRGAQFASPVMSGVLSAAVGLSGALLMSGALLLAGAAACTAALPGRTRARASPPPEP